MTRGVGRQPNSITKFSGEPAHIELRPIEFAISRQKPGPAPAEHLHIDYRAVEALKSYDSTACHHAEKQMRLLVRCI